MDCVERQPHILLSRDEVRPVVIVVGDPARVIEISKLCEESRELHRNREYLSIDCKFKGQWFTTVSHGVGAAGAAICFAELCKLGVNTIIRAGMAGSLQPQKLRQGDLVIVQSCAREDGVSDLLVPKGFPAVTDFDVYNALLSVAKDQIQTQRRTTKNGDNTATTTATIPDTTGRPAAGRPTTGTTAAPTAGTTAAPTAGTAAAMGDGDGGSSSSSPSSSERRIVPGTALTSDLFYAGSVLPSTLSTWSKAKIDVVEMEISALFIITKLNNVRSAALCVVDGCPLGNHGENYGAASERTKGGKEIMLQIAIQTASNITNELLAAKENNK